MKCLIQTVTEGEIVIEWKKYDRNLLLEHEKSYLVSNGHAVDIGTWANYFNEPKWYLPDLSAMFDEDVIYYAEINLPEEDLITKVKQDCPDCGYELKPSTYPGSWECHKCGYNGTPLE